MQENAMGQYQLWLNHREIDQNLRREQTAYEQELSKIDEHIASIENTAMQKSNALLTVILQQLKLQEHITSKVTDTEGIQPERKGATQANTNTRNDQTPPSPHYEQQNLSVSPAFLTRDHPPDLAAQGTSIPEEAVLSADTIPVLPTATDHLQPSNRHSPVDRDLQTSEPVPLPWWLCSHMQITHEEPEPQPTILIDQQSIQTNQRVERWFVRRTKLVHDNERQEGQQK